MEHAGDQVTPPAEVTAADAQAAHQQGLFATAEAISALAGKTTHVCVIRTDDVFHLLAAVQSGNVLAALMLGAAVTVADVSNRTLAPAGTVTYQVEDYDTCRAEIDAHLRAHWLEIAIDQDRVPLDKDEASYRKLADDGALCIVTARRAGELVGYHASIVRPHLHYRSTLHAFVDVYWLRPDCRRGLTGYRLLQAAEAALKARGVKKVFTGTKLHLDMGRLFERMGWRETERLFTRYIGD